MMKKANKLIALILVLCMCFSACGSKDNAPEDLGSDEQQTEVTQEPVTLTYAGAMANTTPIYAMMDEFATRVKEETNGAVSIDIYEGGQLYAHDAMPNAVATGAADMGEMDTGVMMGLSEAAGMCTMSFLTKDWEDSYNLHNRFFDTIDKEMQSNGLKLLFWMPYGTDSGPLTVDKQVTKLEDLSGLMIRGIGDVSCNWLNAAGANAVTISSSETYQALSSGAIKGAMSGYSTYISRGWYECCKYLVGNAFNYCQFLTAMNLDVWNSLAPQTQETMLKIGQELFRKYTDNVAAEDAKNIETLEGYGITVSWIDDDEMQRWVELMDPIYEEWSGRTPACKEIMDYLKSR